MLIAISGSQGSGKTTVIQQLKSQGYPVIERKTARSILDDWGVSLDTVNTDFDLKVAFQDELVTRKHQDELEATLTDEIIFTERTYADLFTYTLIAFGQYNKYDEWLNNYFTKCYEHSQSYSHVFYLQPLLTTVVEQDGVRSTNKYYSEMIASEMLTYTRKMVDSENLMVIDHSDLTDRINIINHIVSK